MKISHFQNLKTWFDNFIQQFRNDNQKFSKNIQVKIDHTQYVCQLIRDIGSSEKLSEEDLRLAEIMALFHDIGRFEQFKKYGTFADAKSENHAELGIRILKENQVLKDLDQATGDLIMRVISYHNRRSLPDKESNQCLFYSKMLRDADKLDIFRVVTEYYYEKSLGRKNEAIELDLPDTPELSEQIFMDFEAGRVPDYKDMRSLNDFKVVQLSWVYDLNFKRSFEILMQRKYLEQIRNALPNLPRVDSLFKKVSDYTQKRIASE